MSARRRRGDEEDLSEGDEEPPLLNEGDEVVVSDDESDKAGIVSSESSESDGDHESEVQEEKQVDVESENNEDEKNDIHNKSEEVEQPITKQESAIQIEEEEEISAASGASEDELENESDKNTNEDEDERHPAYIPRKGLFFLHDDRIDNEYPEGHSGPKMDLEPMDRDSDASAKPSLADEESCDKQDNENEEMDQETERAMRAARKAERMVEKWSHDKYDDDMQLPRTQQELVDRYGFDIRTLNPEEIDFSRPLGQSGDGLSPGEGSRENSNRRGATNGSRRGGPRGGKTGQNRGTGLTNGRPDKVSKRNKAPNMKNQEDFPDLVITKRNEKITKGDKTNLSKKSISNRDKTDIKLKKGRDERLTEEREIRDVRAAKGTRSNKVENKTRKESREKFKKVAILHEDRAQSGRNQRNQRAPRRESVPDYDRSEKTHPDNRLRRKQEQRRRVEAVREHRDNLQINEPHGVHRGQSRTQTNGRNDLEFDTRRTNSRQRSPPRQRIEDPAPPIRSRRYSSDLSDEDINERRRPPPPRRKKNQSSSSGKNIKPQLQVEVANVADILAKHETQARKLSAKHGEYDRIRDSPIKGRRDEKRKDDRRRESDTRIKPRPDEKSSKRYSARTRPEHWNNRQSPSPPPISNDQNFNERSQIQDDPLQDALGKHFNVSAAQAKKFINQIKNQLHVPPPAETGDALRFSHGVSTPSTVETISNFVDSKSSNTNFKNNIGIRDRTNEQSLAFQAYQQQQLQAQFLQSQAQQNSHAFASDATTMDLVTRMTQQDPSFFNQARQQPVGPPIYQPQSIYDSNQLAQISSPSAYVNPSSMSQQQLANSLIQNGTTYFQMEQHNRNKY